MNKNSLSARQHPSPRLHKVTFAPVLSEPSVLRAASFPSVLVIDDSPTIRKIVETTLRREGYAVTAFADGNSALAWLLQPHQPPPSLILVDIGLPDVDGYTILRWLKARRRFSATTCIVISRRDGLGDKLKGRLAGAKAYLPKPFTTRALLEIVRNYVMVDEA